MAACDATGKNGKGQFGDGSKVSRTRFVQVEESDVKAATLGTAHSMILKQDGSLWVTGQNDKGQLGDDSTIDKKIFTMLFSRDVRP